MWGEVSTEKEGTIILGAYDFLYNILLWLFRRGITDVKTGQPLYILVASFGEHTIDFLPNQVVKYPSQHQETIFEYDITHTEVLGLLPEIVDAKFCKRHIDAHDIITINRHEEDRREQSMVDNKKPVAAEDLNLDIT